MTTDDPERSRRSATLRTRHADATLVAAALAPDDTDSMDARVDGDAIVCTIERSTTGGLRSTADDYVVNLRVADRIIERARTYRSADGRPVDDGSADGRPADDGSADGRPADDGSADGRPTKRHTTDRHAIGDAEEAAPPDVTETSSDDAEAASSTDTTSTHNE